MNQYIAFNLHAEYALSKFIEGYESIADQVRKKNPGSAIFLRKAETHWQALEVNQLGL